MTASDEASPLDPFAPNRRKFLRYVPTVPIGPHNAMDNALYLARQPVINRSGDVIGYELLYRDSAANRASFIDPDDATREVVSVAFSNMGLRRLTGDLPAFINVTGAFLANGLHRSMPRERVVLELLETEIVTPELVDVLHSVKAEGYRLALDDFSLSFAHDDLVELANIVKVDLMQCPAGRLKDLVSHLQGRGPLLLAEKVETASMFVECHDLGFDLFQGYLVSRPQVMEGRRVTANRLATLHLASQLDRPNVTFGELDAAISADIGLTYRTLTLVNSAATGLPSKVQGVRQALVMLGLDKVREILLMLALSDIDNECSELTVISLIRAKTCEQLARRHGVSPMSAFTVGMLSLLDSLLDAPMASIIDHLSLSDDVAQALIHRSGRLGQLLDAAIAYEHGDLAGVEEGAVPLQPMADAYLVAVGWAEDLRTTLKSPESVKAGSAS